MTVKSRDLDCSVSFPPWYFDKAPMGGGKISWKGKQYTVSSSNRRSPDGKYREGGNFYTYRCEPKINCGSINFKSADKRKTYKGPICIDLGKFLTSAGTTEASKNKEDYKHLDAYGAEAIALVDPTNPNAQAGVALGEIIKDRAVPIPGIPTWRRRTEVAKAAGSEYLNAVFGWLPLVKDMKNVAQSVKDGNTILENYRAASGTLVHREFAFDDIVESSSKSLGLGFPTVAGGSGIGKGFVNEQGEVTVTTTTTTKRWFSGSFTYLANSDRSSFQRCLSIGSDADKLFGVALTPDLVWELTPWSWAIDWFSNAGSVIHNIGSFATAGLVMQYGYMMEETSTVSTYSMSGAQYVVGHGVSIPPSTLTNTVKIRGEANPFGFGLSWDGLSPTQLAISAALGITRLR